MSSLISTATSAVPVFPQGWTVTADRNGLPVFYQGDYYDTATANGGPQTRAFDRLDVAASAPGSYRLGVNGGVADTLVDLTTGGETSLTISLGGYTAPRGDVGILADANSYILADLRGGRGDFGIYHSGMDGYADFVGVTVYSGFRGDAFVAGKEVEYTSYGNPGYTQITGSLLSVDIVDGLGDVFIDMGGPLSKEAFSYAFIQDTGRVDGDVTIDVGSNAVVNIVATDWGANSTLYLRDVGSGVQKVLIVGDVNVKILPSADGDDIFDLSVRHIGGSSAKGAPSALDALFSDSFDDPGSSAIPADPYNNEVFLSDVSAGIANDPGVAGIIGTLGNIDIGGYLFAA